MAHNPVKLDAGGFMDHFSPLPAHVDVPCWDGNVFEAMEGAASMTERNVFDGFIATIQATGVIPTFVIAETQHVEDLDEYGVSNVDGALFHPERAPPTGEQPHWADQMVALEFRRHDTEYDPFAERELNANSDLAATRRKVRDHIIDYAENIFQFQHRTALFMLLVMGRRFRFLRWDRSGTIVTHALDYYEHPQLLCEMLWRMSKLSDEQLGCDPSATRIHPNTLDYEEMDKLALPNADDLDHTERILQEIPSSDRVFRYVRDMIHYFLVGKPVFYASGMAGRGTRGFIAWDCQRRRFVWLKDAWRAHYSLVDQEGAILRELNAKGVTYIPTVYCHGDILNQTTQTPIYWEMKNSPLSGDDPASQAPCQGSSHTLLPQPAPSSRLRANSQLPLKRKRSLAEVEGKEPEKAFSPYGLRSTGKNSAYCDECPLRRHKHYRLVVDEVAMPLKDFQSGSQLVSIIRDAVIAHGEALRKAGVMHCDVSGGNILIYPQVLPDSTTLWMIWTGMLADWELSKAVGAQDQMPRARQPERIGTWQSMSVAALDDHDKDIEVSDDLESFFHVLLYYAIRYLKSNCKDAEMFIEDYFDSHDFEDGMYICGQAKRQVVREGRGLVMEGRNRDKLKFASPPLNNVIDTLLIRIHAHYVVKAYKAYEDAQVQQLETPAFPVSSSSSDDDDDDELEEESRNIHETPSVTPEDTFAEQSNDEPVKPTAEQESAAPKASSHAAVCFLMARAILTPGWRKDRVKDNNVFAGNVPQPPSPPTPRTGRTSNKRRKTEAHIADAAVHGGTEGSIAVSPARVSE
ncbi:hypothetical protein C8Q77DRAFT_1159518 [Trametes polyzona]|nr:hypothetical protein C8Q77DRAFT_1159518 [Trametes polyzona]